MSGCQKVKLSGGLEVRRSPLPIPCQDLGPVEEPPDEGDQEERDTGRTKPLLEDDQEPVLSNLVTVELREKEEDSAAPGVEDGLEDCGDPATDGQDRKEEDQQLEDSSQEEGGAATGQV